MDIDRYAVTPFGAPRRTLGPVAYVAYHPESIPRTVPIAQRNVLELADAETALGHLTGAGRLLPDPHLLVHPYLRRDAVSSTRIEGSQASLTDLFDAEATDAPYDADIEKVINYVRAMEHGLHASPSCP